MNEHAIPAIVTIETKSASSVSQPFRRMLALDDFEKAAERYLPRPIFGYVSGARETGSSFQANRTAFGHVDFAQRVLRNVCDKDHAPAIAAWVGIRYLAKRGHAAFREYGGVSRSAGPVAESHLRSRQA